MKRCSNVPVVLIAAVLLAGCASVSVDCVSAQVDEKDVIDEVSPMIYGGFVEHLGRNVYGGVYDPEDPTADADGFRADVIDAMKEMAVPCFRYPGGCFTDFWDWQEGVGPREKRPVRLDPFWRQTETNAFGLDEFMKWLGKVGGKPILCLNLSTRGAKDALKLWEYCNFPGGTTMSDLRRKNGHEKPYGVEYWCLGNEIYSKWEIGHRDAALYGIDARETGKLLKKLDPGMKPILSGSNDNPEWNRVALGCAWDFVDFLSVHEIFDRKSDRPFLRSGDKLTRAVESAAGTIREVAAEKKSDRKVGVAVDEYIVWDCDGRYRDDEDWKCGRHALEQDFTLAEAVVVGDLMTILQNHADTVKIACVAQSVNVLAPVRTEKGGKLWHQATFDPMAYSSRYGRGRALRLKWRGNDTDDVHASAILSDDGRRLAVFAVSRREEGAVQFRLEIPGGWSVVQSKELAGDPEAVNSAAAEPVRAKDAPAKASGGALDLELRPCSWRFVLLERNDDSRANGIPKRQIFLARLGGGDTCR